MLMLSTPYARPHERRFFVDVAAALARHPYFSQQHSICNPNVDRKRFCGPQASITIQEWPCRGDCALLAMPLVGAFPLPFGKLCCRRLPYSYSSRTCWRAAFRWHVEQVHASGGYVIQVIDNVATDYLAARRVQEVEAEIALAVGARLVRVNNDGRDMSRILADLQYHIQGLTLATIGDHQGDDKTAMLQAVRMNGLALEFVSERLRGDPEVVSHAVQQSGYAFKYASDELKSNEAFALDMVRQDVRALSALCPPLSQKRSILEAAGLWRRSDQPPQGAPVLLSVPFSLSPKGSFFVNEVHLAMNAHPFFGARSIFNPNFLSKGFCGPASFMKTWQAWPCRGTCEPDSQDGRCTYCPCGPSSDRRLKPTERSCWRYSFRWHQEMAERHGGIMVQILDYVDERRPWLGHRIGAGQEIELEMADEVGLKVLCLKRSEHGSLTSQELRDEEMTKVLAALEEQIRTRAGRPSASPPRRMAFLRRVRRRVMRLAVDVPLSVASVSTKAFRQRAQDHTD